MTPSLDPPLLDDAAQRDLQRSDLVPRCIINKIIYVYSALQLGYITLLELACPLSDHDEVRDCYNYDP